MSDANAEPMFQSHSPSTLSIDGSAMKALKTACDEFLKSGADISDFTTTLSEDLNETVDNGDDVFIVTFMGKLAPGKRGLGTANRVPGSVTYFISRKEWRVIKEQGVR